MTMTIPAILGLQQPIARTRRQSPPRTPSRCGTTQVRHFHDQVILYMHAMNRVP
jgi:hypothetical protein